jgi:hypothetical protein
VTRTTTKVLGGIAVAALAAAGVAAVVNYRRGQEPEPEERAHLDELDARLEQASGPGADNSSGHIGRIVDSLQRNQGISVRRLRGWITAVRHGTLSPEQATVAESDFDALEREADQGGI